MRRAALLALLVAALAASGAHAGLKLKKPKRGVQLRLQPYTIEPGADREWCEYRRLELKAPIDVVGFEARMPVGAHHFVVWGYSGTEQDDTKFPAKPVESVGCTGIGPGELAPRVLIPIQTPNRRFDFPKGLALRLEPDQQIWLNPHMINVRRKTIRPAARFNFYAAEPGQVKHYLEGLIAGNMFAINVPAGGEQTLTAEWTAPATLNLAYLATHQHQLGTYANIEIVRPDGAIDRIYENDDWEHPENLWPEPPIRLEKGQKMRITCRWKNVTDQAVHFGPNTTDEMCFILGFYYRDDGDTGPLGSSQCVPATSGLLCPLAPAVD